MHQWIVDASSVDFFEDSYIPSQELVETFPKIRLGMYFKYLPFHALCKKLIQTSDESSFEKLSEILKAMPEKILRQCIDFGIQFYILDASFQPASKSLTGDGGYIRQHKVAYVKKEALCKPSFQRFPIIYLSHAFDHSLGEDDFASSRRGIVSWLYQATKKAQRFISSYGSSSPTLYFGESMSAYFSIEDGLFGRPMLKELDQPMFDYLDSLFRYRLKCL